MKALFEKLNGYWVFLVNGIVSWLSSWTSRWKVEYVDIGSCNELRFIAVEPAVDSMGRIVSKIDSVDFSFRLFPKARFLAIRPFEIEDSDDFTMFGNLTIPYLLEIVYSVHTRERWNWLRKLAGEEGARSWGLFIDNYEFRLNLGLQETKRFYPNGDPVYLPSGWGFQLYWHELHGKPTVSNKVVDTLTCSYRQSGSEGFRDSDHDMHLMIRRETTSWPRWWKADKVRVFVDVSVDEPPRVMVHDGGIDQATYNASYEVNTMHEAVALYRGSIAYLRQWHNPARTTKSQVTPATA